MKISPNDDNTWTEVAPPAAGIKADRLEKVAHWLASRLRDGHFGAQLIVLRGGRVVLDRSVGSTNRDHARVTPRDRFVIYSLGKPFAALCVHLLAERGLLALDKPVSVYSPPIHVAIRSRNPITSHDHHHQIQCAGFLAEEVVGRIMRGRSLWNLAVWA